MRPKRSLGQNFLTNPHIIAKIIRFADLMPDDTVLEIGPGRGILTIELVWRASRVIAVEKDDKLFAQLKSTFADVPNLTLVHGDILDRNMQVVAPQGAKLLANLPYNIATQIILRLADIPAHFSSIIVMLQKEVGERICASPGTKP
jgi:16S rRNA (adenine1518-N6/adenine1519-N6)-dimethyltransferase